MNWNEKKVLDVIHEARLAGKVTGDAKLAELRNAGPRYAVTDGVTDRVIDTMLDVCGFASLRIKARGKFYLLAKRLGGNTGRRFNCQRAYYGGGSLAIFDSTFRQEMSVNTAACRGQAEVLAKYGIEANVESRID